MCVFTFAQGSILLIRRYFDMMLVVASSDCILQPEGILEMSCTSDLEGKVLDVGSEKGFWRTEVESHCFEAGKASCRCCCRSGGISPMLLMLVLSCKHVVVVVVAEYVLLWEDVVTVFVAGIVDADRSNVAVGCGCWYLHCDCF